MHGSMIIECCATNNRSSCSQHQEGSPLKEQHSGTTHTMASAAAATLSTRNAACFAAARDGDRPALQALLATRGAVDLESQHGWNDDTALIVAAENGRVHCVSDLIAAGASVKAVNLSGDTPLHRAAWRCSEPCVSSLLKAGAVVDAVSESGYTPLHWAAVHGSRACASLLLAAGADVNAADLQLHNTPLHMAAQKGSAPCVSLLLKAGADVNAADNSECTPLHKAAQTGNTACVSLLLEAGAHDVNAATWVGETALHWAAAEGHEACVSLLLMAGADVNAAHRNGDTPLHWAASLGSEACVSLLLEAGADASRRGYTAAHATPSASWLLTAGARVDPQVGQRKSPLCLAVEKGHAPAVAMLAAAVPRLHVPPHLLRPSPDDAAALANASHRYHKEAAAREERRPAVIVALHNESRWRRRRPLALIREQRRAVRDAGRVHKEWERREQQEEKTRARK